MEASIDFRRSYANRWVDGPPINRPVTFPPASALGTRAPEPTRPWGRGRMGTGHPSPSPAATAPQPAPLTERPGASPKYDSSYLLTPQQGCAAPSTKDFPMKSQLGLSHLTTKDLTHIRSRRASAPAPMHPIQQGNPSTVCRAPKHAAPHRAMDKCLISALQPLPRGCSALQGHCAARSHPHPTVLGSPSGAQPQRAAGGFVGRCF